jgi:hypothetical protein
LATTGIIILATTVERLHFYHSKQEARESGPLLFGAVEPAVA